MALYQNQVRFNQVQQRPMGPSFGYTPIFSQGQMNQYRRMKNAYAKRGSIPNRLRKFGRQAVNRFGSSQFGRTLGNRYTQNIRNKLARHNSNLLSIKQMLQTLNARLNTALKNLKVPPPVKVNGNGGGLLKSV